MTSQPSGDAKKSASIPPQGRYRRKTVGVIGSADATGDAAAQARAMGAVTCRLGAHLVCGGLGGVMAEACQGFVEERHRLEGRDCGVTIGILPGDFKSDANPHVDVIVPTGIGMMRNMLVVKAADVIVSVAGGAGTLNEMTAAWQMGKTLISLSATGGWSKELAGKLIDGRRPDTIIDAADVAAAETALAKLIGPVPDRT